MNVPKHERKSCGGCGGVWFTLETAIGSGAVSFTHDGDIASYYGVPVCMDCGETMKRERQHGLRLVED